MKSFSWQIVCRQQRSVWAKFGAKVVWTTACLFEYINRLSWYLYISNLIYHFVRSLFVHFKSRIQHCVLYHRETGKYVEDHFSGIKSWEYWVPGRRGGRGRGWRGAPPPARPCRRPPCRGARRSPPSSGGSPQSPGRATSSPARRSASPPINGRTKSTLGVRKVGLLLHYADKLLNIQFAGCAHLV